MKFKIEEKDHRVNYNKNGSENYESHYRITIHLYNDEIILKREYFYYGFYDGEEYDHFFFRDKDYLTRGSFLTKNFDPEYLRQKENQLIKKIYKKLTKAQTYTKKKLENKIKEYNEQIEIYKECQQSGPFKKYQRKEKLKKLK